MKKALLVHGYNGSPDALWFPWLKKILEEKGFKVFAPQLPNPALPQLEDWIKTLLPIISKFGKKDIVIAHSGGGRTAVLSILGCHKKLGNLFLFAPVLNFDYFTQKFIARSEQHAPDSKPAMDNWQTMNSYYAESIDLSCVSKLVPVTAVFSNDDPIANSSALLLVPKDWQTQTVDDCKHFWREEEPKILEVIIKKNHV